MFAKRPFIFAALLALSTSSIARAETPPDLRAFLVKYRCDVFDRLVQIHEYGNPAHDDGRYIAITVPDGHYVQCMFHDSTRKFFCEAASGFYETPPGARRTAHLPPAAVAGLAKLGFSTDDSHGNFSLDRDVGILPDYMALADLMLTALYAGYDARLATALDIKAPFAPAPTSACDPTS